MSRISKVSYLAAFALPTLALGLAPADATAAGRRARVHLQAPVALPNPTATDLDRIEDYGKTAVWNRTFAVPYDKLEVQVLKLMKSHLKTLKLNGVAVCDDPCPDVTWSVTATPSFKFTKKGTPKLTKIGKSGDNRIRAEVTLRAKAGLVGNIHAEADVPKPMPVGFIIAHEEVDAPYNLFVEAEITAKVDVTMWPDIKANSVKLDAKLVDVSPNIELDGALAKVGANIGLLIGSSPLGLMSGGPLVFSTLLAVIGDVSSDFAEAEIEKVISKAIEKEFNDAIEKAEDAAKKAIDPLIGQANARKNSALNGKLPGVNKSIKQLSTEMGATLAPHTVTPNGDIALSAVMRFNPKKGSGAVAGKVRIPSSRCVYAEIMGARMPIGYEPINKQLDSKVGSSCSSALGGARIRSSAYLGGNPRDALGATAQNLPNWKANMGTPQFTGTLTKTTHYFQCGFKVTAMPNTAISELRLEKNGDGLDVKADKERFLTRRVGSSTLVLDDRLKPQTSPVLGGRNTCSSGGGGPVLTPDKSKELKDLLDNCPACARVRFNGNDKIQVLQPTAQFTKSAIGKHITRLVNASKARGSRKSMKRRRATKANAAQVKKTKSTGKTMKKTSTKSNKGAIGKSKANGKGKALGH